MNLVQRLDSTPSRQEKAQQPCFPADSPPSTWPGLAWSVLTLTLETSPRLEKVLPTCSHQASWRLHLVPRRCSHSYQEGCPSPEPQRGEVVSAISTCTPANQGRKVSWVSYHNEEIKEAIKQDAHAQDPCRGRWGDRQGYYCVFLKETQFKEYRVGGLRRWLSG